MKIMPVSYLGQIARVCSHLNGAVVRGRLQARLDDGEITREVCKLLFRYGFIHSIRTDKTVKEKNRARLIVYLTTKSGNLAGKYGGIATVLQHIHPISFSGRSAFVNWYQLKRVAEFDTGSITIINTTRGWVEVNKAVKDRIGGQLLFRFTSSSMHTSGYGY